MRRRFLKGMAFGRTIRFHKGSSAAIVGSIYKRRVNSGKIAWQCSTYMTRGKAPCPAKQIRESILETVSAEVLGTDTFDAGLFEREINHIRICEGNRLAFIFRDGRKVEKTWKGPSRRDSWTDEMKKQAAEHAKEEEPKMSEARAIAPRVTVLPATRNRFTTAPIASVQKRRVAAYARVSTDSDEQLTSYEAQVDYYTHYIKERPDWTFAGMYADEGISGTNTKRREGFNQMITDALAGKIDLIVTKSVSRFARNTVDSLTTVRRLKEKGVEVYFQKENIYTLDSKGELLITIMSSLAQEESRSISENVTWGQRKRFADGKVSMPYKNFLGYRKGGNGSRRSCRKKRKWCGVFIGYFLKDRRPMASSRYWKQSIYLRPPGSKRGSRRPF